jgi:hypothetical protein
MQAVVLDVLVPVARLQILMLLTARLIRLSKPSLGMVKMVRLRMGYDFAVNFFQLGFQLVESDPAVTVGINVLQEVVDFLVGQWFEL